MWALGRSDQVGGKKMDSDRSSDSTHVQLTPFFKPSVRKTFSALLTTKIKFKFKVTSVNGMASSSVLGELSNSISYIVFREQ